MKRCKTAREDGVIDLIEDFRLKLSNFFRIHLAFFDWEKNPNRNDKILDGSKSRERININYQGIHIYGQSNTQRKKGQQTTLAEHSLIKEETMTDLEY